MFWPHRKPGHPPRKFHQPPFRRQMRAADVVNATAAGSWYWYRTIAEPIAMTAAAVQEMMKTRMFVTLEGGAAS